MIQLKEKLPQEIGHMLVETLMNKHPILHISHDDLDGYACAHLLDHLVRYINPKSTIPTFHYTGRRDNAWYTNITHWHTSKLNDRLFKDLEPLAYGYANGIRAITKSTGKAYDLPIMLITDISGFSIQRLMDAFGSLFKIIILDHHQWSPSMKNHDYYDEANRVVKSKYKWKKWDVTGCSDTRIEVAATSGYEYHDHSLETMRLYINSDFCATKLLMNIMMDAIEHDPSTKDRIAKAEPKIGAWIAFNSKLVRKIVDIVNAYDTGDFGNWYLSKDGIDHVSYQAVLNQAVFARSFPGVDDGLDQYLSWTGCQFQIELELQDVFDWLYYSLRYGWPMDSENPKELHMGDVDPYFEETYSDYVQETHLKFWNLSREYDQWEKSVVHCTAEDLNEDQVKFHIDHPDRIDPVRVDAICRNVVNILDLTPGTYLVEYTPERIKTANMSMYAKRLLERNPEVDFFIQLRENPDTGEVTVSLRSQKEGADCSKIAYENGGGGHIHAAGFTLK